MLCPSWLWGVTRNHIRKRAQVRMLPSDLLLASACFVFFLGSPGKRGRLDTVLVVCCGQVSFHATAAWRAARGLSGCEAVVLCPTTSNQVGGIEPIHAGVLTALQHAALLRTAPLHQHLFGRMTALAAGLRARGTNSKQLLVRAPQQPSSARHHASTCPHHSGMLQSAAPALCPCMGCVHLQSSSERLAAGQPGLHDSHEDA